LTQRGYQVKNSLQEIIQVKSGKLAGFIADEEPPRVSKGRGDQLLQSTQTALEILKQNRNGFFLMVEGSQIDWGSHANDATYVAEEMVDFDKTIGAVLDFAAKDGNTLVIITADHETGGMSLVGGDIASGKVEAKFTTGHHTGVMIPVFAFGPGSSAFAGIYSNTAIFEKMMKAFRMRKD
jgi:alkaline phosphatase